MKTSDDLVAEIVERANQLKASLQAEADKAAERIRVRAILAEAEPEPRFRRPLNVWLGMLIPLALTIVLLIALVEAINAQSGQHSREYRDGCGNRYVDMVENELIESRVPLPPRVCKKVDKGLPTERLVIIEWKQDGYREIAQP